MPEKPLYTVYIHVKPYVRKYLADHFHVAGRGRDVVDLRPDRLLYKEFVAGLTKERQRQAQPPRSRTCRMAVRVNYDILQRHGHALSAQSESQINVRLELRCRRILLQSLTAIYIVCGNLARAIRLFYDNTGYDEDSWPSDSIRKVWQRETFFPKESYSDEIIAKISEKFMGKLSQSWDNFGETRKSPPPAPEQTVNSKNQDI